jgi:hypothetical protein
MRGDSRGAISGYKKLEIDFIGLSIGQYKVNYGVFRREFEGGLIHGQLIGVGKWSENLCANAMGPPPLQLRSGFEQILKVTNGWHRFNE